MNFKKMTEQLKKTMLKHLTGDINNSSDYVYRNIKPNHLKAADWLGKHKGMIFDTYNLHDLIANWDMCKDFASIDGLSMSFDSEGIEKGKFHPTLLIEYFKSA